MWSQPPLTSLPLRYDTETVDGCSMNSGYLVSTLFTSIYWLQFGETNFRGCSHSLSLRTQPPATCKSLLFSSFDLLILINNFVLSKTLVKQQTWISPICGCQGSNMACLLVGIFFLIVDGLLWSLKYFLWRHLSCTRGFHYHGLFVCTRHHLQLPPPWPWY